MGLFDFVGAVISAPLKITGSVVETTVKTAGNLATGNLDKLGRDLGRGVNQSVRAVTTDLADAADEE